MRVQTIKKPHGYAVWFFVSQTSVSAPEIISRSGLHWHADLTINIFGESQDIPAGIGLEKLPHKPIHTHDRDSIIHMEFSGLVREDDLRLGQFFRIWGKTFSKDCIFDKCTGPEGKLTMLVNGKENFEFENYLMRDGDKIEIIFKKEEGIAGVVVKEIMVVGTEFAFSPSTISVKAGDLVKITFQNNGNAPHNLVIEGLGISTKTINFGQTDTVQFTALNSGTYTIFCSIPGHRAAGMMGSLMVE